MAEQFAAHNIFGLARHVKRHAVQKRGKRFKLLFRKAPETPPRRSGLTARGTWQQTLCPSSRDIKPLAAQVFCIHFFCEIPLPSASCFVGECNGGRADAQMVATCTCVHPGFAATKSSTGIWPKYRPCSCAPRRCASCCTSSSLCNFLISSCNSIAALLIHLFDIIITPLLNLSTHSAVFPCTSVQYSPLHGCFIVLYC